jgi:hypothetical protein
MRLFPMDPSMLKLTIASTGCTFQPLYRRQPSTMERVHLTTTERIMPRLLIFLLMTLAGGGLMMAQTGVSINSTGTAPPAVGVLDLREPNVADRNKGLLIPRIVLTGTNVATVPAPAVGLLVYNTAKTALLGNDAQYNVTPGFYIWDFRQRWVRHGSLVRQPALYPNNTILTTTSGAWTAISGMVSATMPLLAGDRVLLKGYGTATSSGSGFAEGLAVIRYDNGGGYQPLPNGSGTTGFAFDTEVTVVTGPPTATVIHRGIYANWGVSGWFDVLVDGTYTFAMGIERLTGNVSIASGTANLPGALLVEIVRP